MERVLGTPGSGRSRKRIVFECNFTSSIRRHFRRKRLELGLSYGRLGEFFGLDWSTVWKWENGPTMRCILSYRPKVEGFLNGDFDRMLLESETLRQIPVRHTYHVQGRDPMFECMERAANTYMLCAHAPSIAGALMDAIDDATTHAISQMVVKDEEHREDDGGASSPP